MLDSHNIQYLIPVFSNFANHDNPPNYKLLIIIFYNILIFFTMLCGKNLFRNGG